MYKKYMYVCVYIKVYMHLRKCALITVGYGIGDPSSNHGRICFHFTLHQFP